MFSPIRKKRPVGDSTHYAVQLAMLPGDIFPLVILAIEKPNLDLFLVHQLFWYVCHIKPLG